MATNFVSDNLATRSQAQHGSRYADTLSPCGAHHGAPLVKTSGWTLRFRASVRWIAPGRKSREENQLIKIPE
jgi:hypothetical protein